MADLLRVALLQTEPLLGDVRRNLDDLHQRLRDLADTDLAVAPELAVHGYHLGQLEDTEALDASDPRLAELGRYGPAVVAGIVESRRHEQYNSAVVVDGGQVRVQRKLFLPTYRGWEERKHFRPGASLRRFELRGANVAVLVCNDLWQPPLPWLAVHGGAEVVVVIASSSHSHAAVPVERAWDILIGHTAVTLQCYVVFVNRAGVECDLEFWGGSRVVGPDGDDLLRLGGEPTTAEVTLDLGAIRTLRRRWPLLREPRLDLVAREVQALIAEEE
jgi:predicted amidohydrolase